MNSEGILRKYLRQAMKSATEDVAEYARTHHGFTARTGALERSVKAGINDDGSEGWVELDRTIAKYGPYVHQGFPPHVIEPRNKKALRWFTASSEVRFAKRVNHPGFKGDPFLFNALDDRRENIFRIFSNRVEAATKEIVKEL